MNYTFLMKLAIPLLILISGYSAFAQTKYQKDFNEFWSDINDNYAYFEEQNIDWKKVKEIYEPQAGKVSGDTEFILLLENMLNELYSGHSSLSVNLITSNRLIPSGLDVYIEKSGGKYIVKDLRKGFGADLAGLKIGMEVTLFNGKPIDEQLERFLPKFTDQHNPKMRQYAIDMLFAGTYDIDREIVATENGKPITFRPVSYGNRAELFYCKILNKNTAYIKINNSLGNNNLIATFDQTLDSLFQYKNLVIDLTETPGGGNSTVARAIMGRFTDKLFPFQIHEFDEKEYQTKRHWQEYVSPRKKTYKGKVYVLVGRWTGSMGEGLAIGFDAMQSAEIIGTQMAGLLGAISNFRLSETKIGFQFPTERLYHIDGTPRADFLPKILTHHIEETMAKAREIK